MVTAKQQQSIDLYQALMSEARYRIDIFNFILAGGTQLPDAIVQELCYLQIRMLCETIALGCLVAHGDIVQLQIKQFEKEWSAERIIERLERLNPDFFPQQMELSRNGKNVSISANTKPNALKKDELTTLWNKCGGLLHRGTLKKLTSFDPKKTRQDKRRGHFRIGTKDRRPSGITPYPAVCDGRGRGHDALPFT